MKRVFTILLFEIIPCLAFSQKSANHQSQLLIGTWHFVETRDKSGKKLDEYEGNVGTVTASGPTMIYKKDGSYTKRFTPKNIDRGWWRFPDSSAIIKEALYIDSTDWIGKDLIAKGLALKHQDGNYYEDMETKVLKLDDNEMLIESRGLINVFRRKK